MTSFKREDWQDPSNPITGPKPKAPRTVGVIHYSASDSIPNDKAGWLRSMQEDYTSNRGYSLGYGFLVPGNGDDYEIRGDDFNMASNDGDKVAGNANDWTLSLLLDVTTNEPATPEAIETCKRILRDRGIMGRPVPHSFYDSTACCGDHVRHQIDIGLFDVSWDTDPVPPTTEPVPPTEPAPTPGDDFMAALPTISYGDTDDYVERMQHLLAAAGYMNAANTANYDGVWGSGTDGAKARFDADHGLGSESTDCGPKSWESLMTGRVW